MPKVIGDTALSLEDKPKTESEDIGGVFKKVYKNPNARNRHYPDNLECYKCGKSIPDFISFYAKKVGRKPQRTVYYCTECVISMFIDV